MPMNRSLYPADWPDISRRIRERAGNKCETCGVQNGLFILRSVEDGAKYLIFDWQHGVYTWPDGTWIRMSEVPEEYLLNERETKVVLTVAHLDHNPANNDDSNLKCLCCRCHLLYDAPHHAANARVTRLRNKAARIAATGQASFFESEAQS